MGNTSTVSKSPPKISNEKKKKKEQQQQQLGSNSCNLRMTKISLTSLLNAWYIDLLQMDILYSVFIFIFLQDLYYSTFHFTVGYQ